MADWHDRARARDGLRSAVLWLADGHCSGHSTWCSFTLVAQTPMAVHLPILGQPLDIANQTGTGRVGWSR